MLKVLYIAAVNREEWCI